MTQRILLHPETPVTDAPPSAGTGLPGPTSAEWRIHDEGAKGGGVLAVTLTGTPDWSPPEGHLHLGYEVAARQADGTIAVERLLGNRSRGMRRRVRGTGDAWMRGLCYRADQLILSAPPADLAPGDTLAGATSGARGTISALDGDRVVLTGQTGIFEAGEALTANGAALVDAGGGAVSAYFTQGSFVARGAAPVRTEWSAIRRKPARRGVPHLRFTISNDRPRVGEAIHVQCHLHGSDCLRPRHEARFAAEAQGPAQAFRVYDPEGESPWGTDRNESRGDVATFAFAQAGPASVLWTVTWRDAAGAVQETTGTLAVTVEDPAAAFAPSQTYDVDGTGLHARARPGSRRFGDLDAAIAAIAASGQPAWLRLDSDQTYPCGALGAVGVAGDVLIEGLEPVSAAATIAPAQAGFGGMDRLALHRLTLDCGGDVTDPEVPPGVSVDVKGVTAFSAVEVAVENPSIGFYVNAAEAARTCLLDCRVTGAFDYAVLGSATYGIAARGFAYTMRPGTVRGAHDGKGESAAPFLTDHGGTWRISSPLGPVGLDQIRVYVEGSWIGASQPTIRLFGVCPPEAAPIHVGRLWGEGPGLSFTPTQAAQPALSQDLVVEGVALAVTTQPSIALDIRLGGTTLRNCALTLPDTPAESGVAATLRLMQTADHGDFPGNPDNADPIRIEAVTFADLRSGDPGSVEDREYTLHDDAPSGGLQIFGFPPGQVTVRDCLVHVPNRAVAGYGAVAGLDATPRWTPIKTGTRVATFDAPGIDRSYTVGPLDASTATPPAATASWRPLPGSPAVGAASSDAPLFDLSGTLRPVPATLGALEP